MGLNLDEGYAKWVGESSHPKTPQASNCLHEPIPLEEISTQNEPPKEN